MTKQNKIKTTAFIAGAIAILAIIYFIAGDRIRNTLNPMAINPVSMTPNTTQNSTESTKQYISKKYGFSFSYPANLVVLQKSTDDSIAIGDVSDNDPNTGPDPFGFGVSIEPTIFTDPNEQVVLLNKKFNEMPYNTTQYTIEKHIAIGGYPAVVAYQISTNGDVDQYKRVFFIKDKLLFTIVTWKENDALWNSFKFTK